MSPRSTEFLDGGKRRLETARVALQLDPAAAISLAYYAMLYAARAALSERDAYAKTHRGTWHRFREQFVTAGRFPSDLASEVQEVQKEREDADYEAWAAPREEAERIIALGDRFLAAVEQLIAELEKDQGGRA